MWRWLAVLYLYLSGVVGGAYIADVVCVLLELGQLLRADDRHLGSKIKYK
jgi:hypothetical protein